MKFFKALLTKFRHLRKNRDVHARTAAAFAKYVAAEYGLKVGPPTLGPPKGDWCAFGNGWTFETATLFIDYRKVFSHSHVRAVLSGMPDEAVVGLEFYAHS